MNIELTLEEAVAVAKALRCLNFQNDNHISKVDAEYKGFVRKLQRENYVSDCVLEKIILEANS